MPKKITKQQQAIIVDMVQKIGSTLRNLQKKLSLSLIQQAEAFPLELISIGDGQKEFNCTVMHWSAYSNYPELLNIFIQKGGDVNVRNKKLDTPLHEAMKSNNVECVRILMDHGADPNLLNKVLYVII